MINIIYQIKEYKLLYKYIILHNTFNTSCIFYGSYFQFTSATILSFYFCVSGYYYKIVRRFFWKLLFQWVFSPMKLQQDATRVPLHQPLLLVPASRNRSYRDVSLVRFVSFLHLLVLFPVPIPGSIPGVLLAATRKTSASSAGHVTEFFPRASKPRIYDGQLNVRPRRIHLGVYHVGVFAILSRLAWNFYTSPGRIAVCAWIFTDTRGITSPLFARQRDFPFPRDSRIERRHYVASKMENISSAADIAERFLYRWILRCTENISMFSNVCEP